MMAYIIYNLIMLLTLPFILIYFLWRIGVSGKSREAWKQQLGFVPASARRRDGNLRIWMHAVSVGEAIASSSVISELKKLLSECEIILSTTTQTGQNVARKSVSADHFIYFPLDLLPAVKGAVDAVLPDVFISVESEIWPNFLLYISWRRIPAVVVNGVVSDRTFQRSRMIAWLYRAALCRVTKFCMQSNEDARRIIDMGAPAERVIVAGNTKFDQEIAFENQSKISELSWELGLRTGHPVFVAGSTNPGEEEPIIEAFRIARERHPQLKMILAPRQIERGSQVAAMIQDAGFTCGRRSIPGDLNGEKEVVVLDTLGELAMAYAIGKVAFVGGTFIPKGGHNILQPIAQGRPVFYGPHTFKIRDLVRIAESGGVGFCVNDGRDLGRRLSELLADETQLEEIRQKAVQLMSANRGASARCAAEIAEIVASQICGVPSPVHSPIEEQQ